MRVVPACVGALTLIWCTATPGHAQQSAQAPGPVPRVPAAVAPSPSSPATPAPSPTPPAPQAPPATLPSPTAPAGPPAPAVQPPAALPSAPTTSGPTSPTTPALSEAQFFPWVYALGGFNANWKTGLGHFLLGVVGALVTVYLFLGEFLPSMGGKTQYDLTRQELEDQKKRRDLALVDREKLGQALGERDKLSSDDVAIVDTRVHASEGLLLSFDRQIRRLEQEASRERWRLFVLGFPMYLLLGGFFASALALNAIQAVAIGFGWTAVADRIGLQKELAVKKQLSHEQINRIETASLGELKQLRESNQKLQNQLAAARSVAETSVLAASRPGGS